MFKFISIFVLAAISTASFANANLAIPYLNDDTSTYQIGSEWGKKVVTRDQLQSANAAFNRAAMATAKIGGGTGFYLGKFNGLHVVATNHHVCSVGAACLGTNASFAVINKAYKLDLWLGTFNDIDLTLMTITVPAADEALLAPLAANFQFNKDVTVGQKLLTIGFGVANNPGRQLMANQDSDCVVLSRTGEYRSMRDPDDLNPGPDSVWSFANGCDVSHGDSGSAMVDRQTGEVMGIIWTGRIPKNAKVQNSTYVQSLLNQPNDDIWKELSYAVPAKKMADSIQYYAMNRTYLTAEVRAALLKIIGR